MEGRPLLEEEVGGHDGAGDDNGSTSAPASSSARSAARADELSELERLRAQVREQQSLITEVLAARGGGAAPAAGATIAARPPAPPDAAAATGTSGAGTDAPALSDEELARRLQEEDEAAASAAGGGGGGAALTAVDVGFAGGPSFDADRHMASLLQSMEVQMARAEEEKMREEESRPQYEDPVWGAWDPPEGGARPHHIICFSMCPCCIGPYCSDARKGVLKRIGQSVSFGFSVLQFIVLMAMLVPRGFAPMEVNPMLGPWPDTLSDFGAKNTAEIAYNGEVWRFLTPTFLHAGLIHLLMNLLMQLRMGLFLEFKWGRLTYTGIYLASGLVSAICSGLFLPDKIGVGASGALMGLMGAWLVDILCEWGDGDAAAQGQRSFQLVLVVINALVVLGFSAVPYIDWAAHAFGMLGGALIACVLFGHRIASERRRRAVRWGGGVAAALLSLVGIVVVCSSAPPVGLLWICGEVQPHFPTIDLQCGAAPAIPDSAPPDSRFL